jgi:hypothetical protein
MFIATFRARSLIRAEVPNKRLSLRPTDGQVTKFVGECWWDLKLGTTEATLIGEKVEKVKITRTFAAGSVEPVVWRTVFEREVPPRLFPELRKHERKK